MLRSDKNSKDEAKIFKSPYYLYRKSLVSYTDIRLFLSEMSGEFINLLCYNNKIIEDEVGL